jgi:hypothetical protein
MGWVRPKRRLGTCLALLALTLNLSLSFAHHHFGEAAGHARTAIAGQADGTDDHDTPAAQPCYDCIVATAAAVAASPPILPPWRFAVVAEVIAAHALPSMADNVHPAFRARGPPPL